MKGLNEENGSTKEAISRFIMREFQDLPVSFQDSWSFFEEAL